MAVLILSSHIFLCDKKYISFMFKYESEKYSLINRTNKKKSLQKRKNNCERESSNAKFLETKVCLEKLNKKESGQNLNYLRKERI